MKNMGSVLALLGGVIVTVAGVLAMFKEDVRLVWNMEFSTIQGFVVVAVVLAIMIIILGFLSFTTKHRLLGIIILAASFAGIVVGSTFTDIAMLFSVCGGILLFTVPDKKTVTPKTPVQNKPVRPL